jgi:hypothetical protein
MLSRVYIDVYKVIKDDIIILFTKLKRKDISLSIDVLEITDRDNHYRTHNLSNKFQELYFKYKYISNYILVFITFNDLYKVIEKFIGISYVGGEYCNKNKAMFSSNDLKDIYKEFEIEEIINSEVFINPVIKDGDFIFIDNINSFRIINPEEDKDNYLYKRNKVNYK